MHIKAVQTRTRRSYGRPRILRELRHAGIPIGKNRLQKLMQKEISSFTDLLSLYSEVVR